MQCVSCYWHDIPMIREWFRRINNMRDMEELINISQDRMSKFTATWFCWLDF